jgi:peptidoglycan/xylan/chitin deacetylase (PgdA/CDA1 family)
MPIAVPYLTPLGLRWQERRRPDLLWRLPTTEREVALTIDDGPSAKYTPAVLEALAEAGVKATFFVLGDRCLAFPEMLEEMARQGHGIALHGDTHQAFTDRKGMIIKDRLARNRMAILPENVLPLFRPPFGKWRRGDSAWIHRLVNCSILPGDLVLQGGGTAWVEDPRRCAERVRRELHPGAIIALHCSERLGTGGFADHGIFETPRAAEVVREVCRVINEEKRKATLIK